MRPELSTSRETCIFNLHSDIFTCKNGSFWIEVAAILDFTYFVQFPQDKKWQTIFFLNSAGLKGNNSIEKPFSKIFSNLTLSFTGLHG